MLASILSHGSECWTLKPNQLKSPDRGYKKTVCAVPNFKKRVHDTTRIGVSEYEGSGQRATALFAQSTQLSLVSKNALRSNST